MNCYMLIFYEGRTWLDRIIRYRTFFRLLRNKHFTFREARKYSRLTHVALYSTARKGIIEAVKGAGVRYLNGMQSCYRGCQASVYHIAVSNLTMSNIWNLLEKEIDKKYDDFGAIGLFLHRNNLQDQDKWFCSELIAAGFWKFGLRLVPWSSPTMLFPGEMVKSLLLTFESRIKV